MIETRAVKDNRNKALLDDATDVCVMSVLQKITPIFHSHLRVFENAWQIARRQ